MKIRMRKLVGTTALLAIVLRLAAQPVITNQPTSQTAVLGGTTTFSVGVSGTGPFTYQWQLNGTNLPNNIITTIAGNGTTNYSGDGGAAISAGLNEPNGICVDAIGNLFIADSLHNCIRKVDTNGIITTVAGNGTNGFAGDGGQATRAKLSVPDGVTADAAGNLYISDYYNSRIRFLNTNGIISTISTGAGGPSGVALGTGGAWYIAAQKRQEILKVAANGIVSIVAGNGIQGFSGNGVATNVSLNDPNGIALDARGNLYIADFYNFRVRKVDTNGNITTFAGNNFHTYPGDGVLATRASLDIVSGICFDPAGNLYIATQPSFNLFSGIRKVDTNSIITTFAGTDNYGYSGDGGPATRATFGAPYALAYDTMGNLYVSDYEYNCIREIHATGWPSLTLYNVVAPDAGNYSVIITSASGSVTSSVANLSLSLPPIAPTFTVTNGLLSFQWGAASNLTYQLQYATNLAPAVWTDLGSPITANTNFATAIETNTSDTQRFYRVRLWP